jgi:hypothetical protein
MLCEHLKELEAAILARGIKETYRGKAWTDRCREWVYFDCLIDPEETRKRYIFAECVRHHEHFGTHDGQESGFVCSECNDAVMGLHPRSSRSAPGFP